MKALIVADGDVDAAELAAVATSVDGQGRRPLLICADGGAGHAFAAGPLPDLVVGDGDSITAEELQALRERGIPLRLAPADKDESDTELCIREAILLGADDITILGALGGRRPEHTFANVGLLGLPELDGRRAVIEHHGSSLRLLGRSDGPTSFEIEGRPTDFVSLLPYGDGVEDVTTDGLRYPLAGEALPVGPARGLSNELVGSRARVRVGRGRILVIQTRSDPEKDR